jgi:hypothetical protein
MIIIFNDIFYEGTRTCSMGKPYAQLVVCGVNFRKIALTSHPHEPHWTIELNYLSKKKTKVINLEI